MQTATENHNWKSMFNRDFYPTPQHVLDLMQLDCRAAFILEPSAGKGDIIDYCKAHGARDVMFCEINTELAEICKSKARFLSHDFLKVERDQISHITQIVMNPPFSKATQHILHAWEIAPEGCEITALCNSETVRNWRQWQREELYHIVEEYGNTFELGNCFELTAERKTTVEVSCIKLYKPMLSGSGNFDGFYMDVEEEMTREAGIMQYNEVEALVNSYKGALQCFDEFAEINDKMKRLCGPVGMNEGFEYNISYDKKTSNKTDFAKALQVQSWKFIFGKMNLGKYLTSGVMADINKFVEHQSNVPFTVKNVYRMFEIIVGTKDQSLNRALVGAVEEFTKHTHENRYGVEGWKTNAGHLLNKKFIVDWIFEASTYGRNKGKLTCRYNSNTERIDDLVKVLCNLTGFDYNDTCTTSDFVRRFDGIESNRWYCNGFFEFKGFKKGTMHLKFTDEKVWEMLNRKFAEIKGHVLPEKF